ncbi:ornithine--oxo-acid transaminase [Micromonospora sp. NPDC048830]|uniref:ornithine--oxo-acid transaminase n=1 Tax=Micromonospora sp. NPDC048830 TaxID=3364257 RepID=UPI0037144F6A
MNRTTAAIKIERDVLAHNYHPLSVVVERAEGSWITDVDGKRYLDCLAGYSALNFGHGHPALLAAARAQLARATLTSRAFHNDRLGPFAAKLADLCGMHLVLPMNTGAEAVETGIKVARRWAYQVKGVPADDAEIVVAAGNFHGRTTTVVSFSTDEQARTGFGPFTPGFTVVPYDDLDALEAAVGERTAAVLVEPIQGEAGVVVPSDGYLAGIRRICDDRRALFVADEIQSGLGRVGATFACELAGVRPDIYLLGKALGGGVVPVSAVVSSRDVLGLIRPGEHGSTFGGNPLAAAVGSAVVDLLATGEYQAAARRIGDVLHRGLRDLIGHGVTAVRGVGAWAGVDIDPAIGSGRQICEALAERGVLVKDTHGSTIRFAPPLVTTDDEIRWALDRLREVLAARQSTV